MKRLVVDASLIAAALVQKDAVGAWAIDTIDRAALFAPHLLFVEVANCLRHVLNRGELAEPAAELSHATLQEFAVQLFPYRPFAPRVWELRHNVKPYDAWYVALAEALDLPLATLDRRLTQATGPRCAFWPNPH